MDVLQELLVLQVLGGVAGQALEGGIDEGEPVLQVVRQHPFPHGGRDGGQLAPRGGGLRPTSAEPAYPADQEHEQQEAQEEGPARGGSQADRR